MPEGGVPGWWRCRVWMIRCSLTTAASIKANTQNVFSLRGRNVQTSLGQGSRIKISDVTSPKRSYSLNTGSIHHHMEGECEQTHVRHPHMNVHVVVFFGFKTHLKKPNCFIGAFLILLLLCWITMEVSIKRCCIYIEYPYQHRPIDNRQYKAWAHPQPR